MVVPCTTRGAFNPPPTGAHERQYLGGACSVSDDDSEDEEGVISRNMRMRRMVYMMLTMLAILLAHLLSDGK